MSRDYTGVGITPRSFQKRSIKNVFDVQHRTSIEGKEVRIDNSDKNIRAIIQMHTNPVNENLEDKLIIVDKEEGKDLRWGSFIVGYDENVYLTLTNPTSTDGVTVKAKIRELTNIVKWTDSDKKELTFPTISTRYLMYDDKTYTNETKLFEQDDRIAVVLPINKNTKKLSLIDDVYVDCVMYKILKLEEITDKTKKIENGIFQIVLIRTTFGEITVNGAPLNGVIRFARMKDKVLNSKSRELITLHNKVKTGDYIAHKYVRDDTGEQELRNYIVRSLVDMRLDYDITYIINCDSEFHMWDKKSKAVKMIPCYVEDNRTRFREDWKPSALIDTSEYQIIVQENSMTKMLGEKVRRILIKDKAYEVVGVDNISLENAIYVGLKSSKIDPNSDNLELGIADFDKMNDDNQQQANNEILGESSVYIGEVYEYSVESGNYIWKISDKTDCEGIAKIIEQTGNSCKIQISDNYRFVGSSFNLDLCVGSTVSKTFEIQVASW